ncbi:TPA: FGGY-family carbohydrate kinase, partial [Shigella sonnei]
LPFLYGSNAGLEMTSGFYGMQAIHTRAHLLQAIYEGVVFSHMTHLNRMRERFTDVHTLRVTGGPAHSDVWMQMLADVSGLRIELPQVEETGCFGAALAARVGTGVYRDFSEAQREFDVVSTALCAGIEDEFTLNAVMGTWAVTSGITRGLRDGEAHPYVYGRYVNDGEFIVHEASPTSSGNLEWFTAQWGEISFDEINQAVASLPKAGGDLF